MNDEKQNSPVNSENSVVHDRYLSFNLGKEEYAMPLLEVKEVIAMPEFTPVPYTPAYFLGIMNLRGLVISVLDLRQKFNLKSPNTQETAVIICDLKGMSIGVVVDSINSVLAPEPADVSAKPDLQSSKGGDFITGVYRKGKELILFLDIARTLNLEDHQALAKAASHKKAA